MLTRTALVALLLFATAAAVAADSDPDEGPDVFPQKNGLRLSMQCGNHATDARLARLADHPAATELWLSGEDGFTGSGLAVLAKLPRVRVLYLTGEKVTADGLKHLAGHPALTTVLLHRMPLTPEAAGHVAAVPNLEELKLRYTPTEPESWSRLAKAARLRTLVVWPRAVLTDADVERLGSLAQLTELRLMGRGMVTPARVERLRRLLPAARVETPEEPPGR